MQRIISLRDVFVSDRKISEPFFSVIIPAFNAVTLVSETLKSALWQIYDDYEVIVINDGSTDGTRELILSFVRQYASRVRFFEQNNRGQGEARNMGINKARGQYLAFLDSDDIWFPWTLQVYASALQSNGYPAILIGSGIEFSDPDVVSMIRQGQLQMKSYPNYLSLAKHPYIPAGTPGTVVRTDEARRIGGFSSSRFSGEDQELLLKLGAANGLIHVSSPVTVAIRRHAGNFQKNIEMTIRGAFLLISKEKNNQYSSDAEMKWSRRLMLTRVLRTMSVQCLKARKFRDAWGIYWQTLRWHLVLMRLRYVFGFPLLFMYNVLPSKARRK
jgi:glycosyltransferase involved in cell wall biosynthesis